jgi:hypothetical protein
VRQHLAQLVRELGRQRLVRQHDQYRPLHPLGQPGHRGGLPGSGRTEQDGVPVAAGHPALHLGDRPGLVAGRDHVRDHLERRHPPLQVTNWSHDIASSPGLNGLAIHCISRV